MIQNIISIYFFTFHIYIYIYMEILYLKIFLFSRKRTQDFKINIILFTGLTQKLRFWKNRFFYSHPTQFISYLKSFSKGNSDINKPLQRWIPLWILLNFRTFESASYSLVYLTANTSLYLSISRGRISLTRFLKHLNHYQ